MALNISRDGLLLLNHAFSPAGTKVAFSEHSHPMHECGFYIGGSIRFSWKGQTIEPRPNSLLLIPRGVVHLLETDGTSPYERWVLHFSSDILQEPLRDYLITMLFSELNYIENAEDLQQALITLETSFALPLPLRNAAIRINLSAFLLQVANRCSQPNHLSDGNDIIAMILEFIHMNIAEPMLLTSEALAQRFFISRSQLNKLFQRETGVSLAKYVRSKRFEFAEILRSRGMPAVEAATKAGFQNYSTYYRIRCAEKPEDCEGE